MKITPEKLQRIGELAKLDVSDNLEHSIRSIEKILNLINLMTVKSQALNLDLDNIPELLHPIEHSQKLFEDNIESIDNLNQLPSEYTVPKVL